jgi:hypothetical protein
MEMKLMDQKWTYGLWGAAIGAVLCAIVGMKFGGWETSRSAQALAQDQVNAALVKVLTPICVANFQAASDAKGKLTQLKAIDRTWEREQLVRDGKWAEIGMEQNRNVVDACAAALYKL